MIPHMGYSITSRYIMILASLSSNLNIIVFPFVLSPSMFASRHKRIAIGFVSNSHQVKVKFKYDYPLAPFTNQQRQNGSEGARAWEIAYT